jgi:hypothetical protein
MRRVQDVPGEAARFADACYLLWRVDRHCDQVNAGLTIAPYKAIQTSATTCTGVPRLSGILPLFWALLRISLVGSPLLAYSGLGMLSGTCR